MSSKVSFKGFSFGNCTKELNDNETIGSALKSLGVDTTGIAVMLNGGRVEEVDLKKLTLRDGDTIQAGVKAVGGNEDPAVEPESTDPATE